MKTGVTLFLLLISAFTFGQSVSAKLHNEIDEIIFSEPEKAYELAVKSLQFSFPNSHDQVIALCDVGKCAYYLDDYSGGKKSLNDGIKLAISIKDKEGEAWCRFHLGDLLILQGEYLSAIVELNKAKEIFQGLKITNGSAMCLNAIGSIYLAQDNYQDSQQAIKQAIDNGTAVTKGDSYGLLAQLYMKMEAYPAAISFAQKALNVGVKNDDAYVQATALDVLGNVLQIEGEFDYSKSYLKQALKLKESLNDQQGFSLTCLRLGELYRSIDKIDSAFYFANLSYAKSSEIGAIEEQKGAAYLLSRLHAKEGNYAKAFEFQNEYVALNEALMNEQAAKKMAELKAEVAAQMDQKKIALLQQERDHETQRNQLFIWLATLGILLFGVIVWVLLARNRIKQKSLHAINLQKGIIELQNQEILESIRYAKRLQEAILPDRAYMAAKLPPHFVLYLPKDIVAGDFYWFEETDSSIYLACCDCTGHGVPGALVSVVCSNALQQALIELHEPDPGVLLNETRKKVIAQFNKLGRSEQEVRDGMDISLLKCDKQFRKAMFAGAHHAIWIFSPDSSEPIVIKGDKQPIGKYATNHDFKSIEVNWKKGDRIYMFSDGYADQFGGQEKKKLKNKQLQTFLAKIQNEPIENHGDRLHDYFNSWKENEEQVDDVTAIGLEV